MEPCEAFKPRDRVALTANSDSATKRREREKVQIILNNESGYVFQWLNLAIERNGKESSSSMNGGPIQPRWLDQATVSPDVAGRHATQIVWQRLFHSHRLMKTAESGPTTRGVRKRGAGQISCRQKQEFASRKQVRLPGFF